MQDVEVIEDPDTAVVALDRVRARLLAALVEPGSAAALAARTGISRQKVNYHLNALEARGLVRPVGERRWGGITERVLQASAATYIVSPTAVDPHALDAAGGPRGGEPGDDELSGMYAISLAGRSVREVGALLRVAGAEGRRLPTLTIDTTIGFASPEDRAAFADELGRTVRALAAKYHHDSGRPHRLVVTAYPQPQELP